MANIVKHLCHLSQPGYGFGLNTSSWTSNCRYLWATREQGNLTLVGHRDYFVLLQEEAYDINVPDLDTAIQEADKTFPPDGWKWQDASWKAEGWIVSKVPQGWAVFRDDGTAASKQYYPRADQGRKWCEIRADRVGMSLRGPKPAKAV